MTDTQTVDPLQAVDNLLELLEAALGASEDPEAFVEKTDSYLQALSSWQQGIDAYNPLTADDSPLSEEQKDQLKDKIERLSGKHQTLMKNAGMIKDDVGNQMTEIHRKSQGLRKYIDVYPSRVSITGKRKG